MTVGNQLACLPTRAGKTSTVDDVVQAGLQENHQVVTGFAGATVRFGVVTAELLFHDAVGEACLLLLLQLEQVFGFFDPGAASLSRRVGAALEVCVSTDEVDAETAGFTCCGTGITGHCLSLLFP